METSQDEEAGRFRPAEARRFSRASRRGYGMEESESEADDARFVRELLEPLHDDKPTPPRSLVKRALRRARVDILLRDVVDFLVLRFLHVPRVREKDDPRD